MSHVFSHTWDWGRIWGGADYLGFGGDLAGAGKDPGFLEFFFGQSAQSALEHQLW